MDTELKEGDEVALRGKVTAISPLKRSAVLTIVREKGSQDIMVYLDDLRKVRPGTYEVTTRELVKMLAKLFRYKRLMAEIIAHEGRLNKMIQRRARRFFRARLKELRRKRGRK